MFPCRPQVSARFYGVQRENFLTGLYEHFWGRPENTKAVENGDDIEFNSDKLECTGQRLYFVEQYADLRDRINAFREHDIEEWKRCVIVTGTPGIGKAFHLLSPSDITSR